MKKLIFLSLLTFGISSCVIVDDDYDPNPPRPYPPRPYPPRPQPPRPDYQGMEEQLRFETARALQTNPRFVRIYNVQRSPHGLTFNAQARERNFQCIKGIRSQQVRCRP